MNKSTEELFNTICKNYNLNPKLIAAPVKKTMIDLMLWISHLQGELDDRKRNTPDIIEENRTDNGTSTGSGEE